MGASRLRPGRPVLTAGGRGDEPWRTRRHSAAPREAIPEDEAQDFAHALISSRRVEGTAVYSEAGEKLGTIHSVMIGKKSGQVAYAVLSAGGWLGIGAHVHPLPWELLTYDVDRDGYVVAIGKEQLQRRAVDDPGRDRPADRPQLPGAGQLLLGDPALVGAVDGRHPGEATQDPAWRRWTCADRGPASLRPG